MNLLRKFKEKHHLWINRHKIQEIFLHENCLVDDLLSLFFKPIIFMKGM